MLLTSQEGFFMWDYVKAIEMGNCNVIKGSLQEGGWQVRV